MKKSKWLKNNYFKKKAFTLVELLVVIYIIALLLAVLMPALNKARIQSRKIVCANQLKTNIHGLMIFAAQNNQIVPQNQSKGTWLWDIAYTTTDVIEKNGGMRQTFYCPSGSINWNNDQYWRFSEAISGSAVVNGKISEPEPSSEQIRAYLWRVTSYTNMIELAPPIGPRSASPAGTGNKKWIKNLGAIKQSSAMEIICDTTLYSTISKKWSYVNTSPPFQWSISTNHIVKNAPDGGNSGFCDGHVKWTPFNKMEKRYGYSVRDSLGDPVPAGATGAMPIFYW